MRKRQAERLTAATIGAIAFVLQWGAKAICQRVQLDFVQNIQAILLCASITIFSILVTEFLLSNRIYKGFRYFLFYWTTVNRLENQLIDAGFGIQRSYYVELPKIRLSFSSDFSTGKLEVQNSVKFDKRLDDAVLSAALGKFVVERHYQADDGNAYIYELVDGAVSFKMEFSDYSEFQKYNATINPYQLFLDKRSRVKLQHTLVVGQTGSGKTVELYNLILQMLNKPIAYEVYFADPKGSSLAVLGSVISENRTAVDFDSIVNLLQSFVEHMRNHKVELRELLKSQLDADYSTFGLSPGIFIFDEYASFAAVLASQEKKTRDAVKSLLYEIILQGRQLGYFLVLAMQKSDATLLETALRDNLPLKLVLGNAEQQTYITTFGHADIPNRHYTVGEGVFTEPTLAPEPKLVQCPYCTFDILQAVRVTSPGGVTTRAPENKDN